MRPTLPEWVALARHAETATPAVFHGAESDIGLSELGRRQAAAAAGWFAGAGLTAVVSSAMLRARDTAAPIAAACGVPHEVEPDLYERRVGPLAGTALENPARRQACASCTGVAGKAASSASVPRMTMGTA